MQVNKFCGYLSLSFLSGTIAVFAFAPFNLSFIILISILGLLFSFYKSSASAFKIGYSYGIGFFAIQIYWLFYSLYFIIKAGSLIASLTMLLATLYLALYPALALYLYKKYKTNYELFNLMLLFPSIWVLLEWLRGWFFLNGYPWSDIGYTQVDNYLSHGYFRVIGEYGVSWLSISIIGTVFYLLYFKRNFRISIFYIIMILIAGYALSAIKYTYPNGEITSVALVQPNILGDEKWGHRNHLDLFLAVVQDTHADIIFLPETGIADFAGNLPKGYMSQLESYAKMHNSDLFVGLPIVINSNNDYVNAIQLVTESGQPYYAKYHLVPYGEYIPLKKSFAWLYKKINLPMVGFSSGLERQEPIKVKNQKIAFNICYENGFANEVIAAAKNATLLANISDMAWFGNTIAMNQHLQLSQARAIENQRYFIQETNTSITALINPDGKLIASLQPFTRGVLKGNVEGMVGTTLYQKLGNYPIIILCCLIVGYALIFRRRQRQKVVLNF